MKRLLGIAMCLSLVIALVGCSPKVPDVRGMTADAAARALTAAGYAAGAPSYDAASSDVPGTVVAQDPGAGEGLASGSTVLLRLAGPAPVLAPVLGGLEATAAAAAVEDAGLQYEVTEAYHDTIPKGQVISQTPAAGADAPPGSTIRIVISKGPEPVTVPKVIGKTAAEASAALTAAGFNVVATTIVSREPSGAVFAQRPAGGKTAKRGSTVKISVSGDSSSNRQLRGTWKAKDGSTYEFRAGNRVATPSGGTTRYRLAGESLMIFHSGRMVLVTLKWVTSDRITISVHQGDKAGPAVAYDRVK